MGRGELVVNRVARMGGTLVGETDIPSGVVRTPVWIPKIETSTELEIVLSRRGLSRPPEIACFSIDGIAHLTAGRSRAADQRTITGASADPQFDKFRTKTFTLVDPLSEYFTTRKANAGGSKRPQLHERILRLPDFPEHVAALAARDEGRPEEFWQDVVAGPDLLSLVDWCYRYQKGLRPAFYLPPVNVIEGKSSLELAQQINRTAAESFPPGEDPVVPATYLIIGTKVWKSSNMVQTLYNTISDAASDQRLIVTKALWSRNIIEDGIKRANYRDYLARIDRLKLSLEDSFLHFVMDARDEGLACLGNGADAYIEPMSGYFPYPRAPKKKEEAEREAIELELEEEELWLHPVLRTDKPMSEDEIRRLCSCPAHSDSLLSKVGRRRAHRANVRTREIEMLVDAVGSNDQGFIRRVLSKGENQNILGLLPAVEDPTDAARP